MDVDGQDGKGAIVKNNIAALLQGNGNLISAARKSYRSLSRPDRNIILRARAKALEAGFSKSTINALEMEGELGQRGIAPDPIDSVFIGLQDMSFFGLKFRLYNIEGDHPLNHSTTTTLGLLRQRIMPLDITPFQVGLEALKELLWMLCLSLWSAWDWIKGKVS